ncbi:unnamed protein product [Rotaria sordida]|uniref:Uncharacterized protein n=1 Tax=Rotaria sordida TaxID=392033 RepID=A0A818TXS1_9BILA|nr:unnamed protein product [Rotaria sordida]CAF3692932.1 unnamed protein product [Rotaria sordida]
MQDQQLFSNQIHLQRKQIIPKQETESDESNTKILIDNEFDSRINLSTLSTSSHSSPNNIEEQTTSISSEALKHTNSISYPPLTITGIPAFTSHSSPAIVHFLRSLVNAHPTLPRISDTSWRLNNKNQLLLCAPTRDVFSLLFTNTYLSTIGTSTIQVTPPRGLPVQLSLLLLNISCYLDANYLSEEIQKQFRSVKYLHRIRTSSNTNNSTLIRIDFEIAQECNQCLQAQYLRVLNVHERLPPVTPISSRSIPSIAPHHTTENTTNTIAPKSTSTTVIVPQSSRSISNFIDFMQTIVKSFEDLLSNFAKQMTNLTVLSIIQEHKIDYVSSLIEKIMLPSFMLITETLLALVHLILDSSMHVNQKETISNQLQKTSMFLNTTYEQHQSFKKSLKQTRKLMIDNNIMNLCANHSLSDTSTATNTISIFSSTS